MSSFGKKCKKKGRLPSTTSAAQNDSSFLDNSKAFAYLEIILQNCDKSLWTRACNVFMDTNHDIKETCKAGNLSFKKIKETFVTDSTDFVKYSKILDYVPKSERTDYLWIFLDCWNLSTAFNRISFSTVLRGEPAPTKDQWPYKIPTNEQNEKFVNLLDEVGNDPQVYALFRMHNYDVTTVRQLLGLSSDNSINDTVVDEEFEKICKFLEPAEQIGAFEIYCSNDRNVALTCQLLGIEGSSKTKTRRNPRIKFNVNREFARPKSPLLWPDHEKQEPAEILFQIQEHPLVIDMHYYTCLETNEALSKFLSYHRREKTHSELRIITGKGNNSEDKSILKEHVQRLLKNMNISNTVDPKNTGQILLSLKPHRI